MFDSDSRKDLWKRGHLYGFVILKEGFCQLCIDATRMNSCPDRRISLKKST